MYIIYNMNFSVSSKRLINQLNILSKKKLNRVVLTGNLNKFIDFLNQNYKNFRKQEIKLVSESKNIERKNVFLNNIDTCQKNKVEFLLNIEVILSLLNNKHKNIIDKMLKLHKYSDIKKKQIYDFLNNLGNYKKNEVIEWMNQNGIELMRSFYIFLVTRKLPPEVYKIIDQDFEIYGEFTSLDIQGEIELSLPFRENYKYRMNEYELDIILNDSKEIIPNKLLLERSFFLNYLTKNTKPIKLKLWMSKVRKSLPKKKKLYLGPKEVNSGCTNGFEISLWRKEEISKVLIHELMHFLDLEKIPDIDKIREYIYYKFDINRDVRINFFESYTEIWADIINICLLCFNKKKTTRKKNRNDSMKKDILELLNIELKFSLFQCAKVLNYLGYQNFQDFYNYNGFINKTNKFKQKSNVFSYYIGRSLLFYNFEKFINLCYKFNTGFVIGNKIPSQYFIELMEDTINNTDYVQIINIFIKEIKSYKKNDLLKNTMRFTCIEEKI